MKCALLFALLLLAPGFGLRADWFWDKVSAVATTRQGEYHVKFQFENRGPSPVTVTAINFSCICTHYFYKAPTVRPGGKGELRIDIVRDSVDPLNHEVKIIAMGSHSATPQELTVRIPEPDGSRREGQ